MSARDQPRQGYVVDMGYLWREEQESGHDRSLKRRPCVIVHAHHDERCLTLGVVPITHSPPSAPHMQEIPSMYLKGAGLDAGCSVVLNEMNQFTWPQVDPEFELTVRGVLPDGYFQTLLGTVRSYYAAKLIHIVDRDEMARQIVQEYSREKQR